MKRGSPLCRIVRRTMSIALVAPFAAPGGRLFGEAASWLAVPGSVWFAATTPGGSMVPVRVVIPTRFVGDVTVYLAAKDE